MLSKGGVISGGEDLQALVDACLAMGAGAAAVVPPGALCVEERFVDYCRDGCPSYGMAPGCPPHAMTPSAFRSSLVDYTHVIVFRVDAPMEVLKGEGRVGPGAKVHDIAASLESKARCLGFTRLKGIAAGSCRDLFCRDKGCEVLSGSGVCPLSHRARPSLSALGVDVGKLCELVGWKLSWDEEQADGEKGVMGMMIGMLLVG